MQFCDGAVTSTSQKRLDACCAAIGRASVSLERYWNYLRRQLYVMDTYVTPRNRLVNHSMLGLHTYLSWAFVLPCLTGASVQTACMCSTFLLTSSRRKTQHIGAAWAEQFMRLLVNPANRALILNFEARRAF